MGYVVVVRRPEDLDSQLPYDRETLMPQSTNGQSFAWLRNIHFVRVTKGPRDTYLVFCSHEACGFLNGHNTFEAAKLDCDWHREEMKNG